MSETYRDGVQMERCLFCGGATRDAENVPVTMIRTRDIEQIICILVEYVDCPEVWGETIQRLERAVGRTHRQINQAEHAQLPQAEVITARTDRGGLEQP